MCSCVYMSEDTHNIDDTESQLSHNKLKTEEQCYDAIYKYSGNVTKAAESLGINRRTLTRYIKDSDELKDALLDARESHTDEVEEAFKDQLLGNDAKGIKPNPIAQMFYLKCHAKNRGYIERPQDVPAPEKPPEEEIKLDQPTIEKLQQYLKMLPSATPDNKEES